jgi:hypothetical protein
MLFGSEIVIPIGSKPLLVLREARGEQVGHALRRRRDSHRPARSTRPAYASRSATSISP